VPAWRASPNNREFDKSRLTKQYHLKKEIDADNSHGPDKDLKLFVFRRTQNYQVKATSWKSVSGVHSHPRMTSPHELKTSRLSCHAL